MLNVIPYPEINEIDDQTLCDVVGNGEVEFDLTSLTQDILGDLEIADYTTTYYLSESDAETSSNELNNIYNITDGLSVYTRVDALDTGCSIYTTEPIITFTVLPGDDSSFTLTATCDGTTAEITGVAGGTFAFVNAPTDGAVIDATTGTVTGGDYGSTYDISYTSNDLCPTTTIVPVTTILADDSSFILTATCDGATAEITGVTGGEFAFVNAPTDGAVIDVTTGTVTGGDYGSTYDISYTSADLCPTTTINSVVVETPPEINNPTALEVCDDNIPDGLTAIDLTLKNNEITGGNPNYSVYYFISLEDAETAVTILSGMQNEYIKMENMIKINGFSAIPSASWKRWQKAYPDIISSLVYIYKATNQYQLAQDVLVDWISRFPNDNNAKKLLEEVSIND